MPLLTCPLCGETTEPAARVATLAVCGACGASLRIDAAGTVSRATAQDTAALGPADLQTLTRAHAAITRPDRKPH
jgi:predicted amidohydrolase